MTLWKRIGNAIRHMRISLAHKHETEFISVIEIEEMYIKQYHEPSSTMHCT